MNVVLSKAASMLNVLIRVNILVVMVLLKKFPMVRGFHAEKIAVRKISNVAIIPLAVPIIVVKEVARVVKQKQVVVVIIAVMKKVMSAVIERTHPVVMQQIVLINLEILSKILKMVLVVGKKKCAKILKLMK
tara:strand:- start:1589 stop:1984 length:396 start_codon:yes stop_codon:yes gene_type:complete